MRKINKESAYPVRSRSGELIDYGLTKREYFACAAMQGLLSDNRTVGLAETAKLSVNIADELLLALAGEENEQ